MVLNLNKYLLFAKLEFTRFRLYIPRFWFNCAMIFVRLCLPYSVFYILYQNGQIDRNFMHGLIFAVLFGQIVNRSTLRIHEEITSDIRTGNIGIRLSEPVNYVWAKIAASFGYFIPNFLLLNLVSVPICYFLFPTNLNLPLLFLLSFLANFLGQAINVTLGLLSFIVEQTDGIFWIVNKLFFVFGSQVIPVALMPTLVINFAQFTLFYLVLAAPVEIAMGRFSLFQGLLLMIFYLMLFLTLAQFLLSKLQKNLILNG